MEKTDPIESMEDFASEKRRKLFTWVSLFATIMGLFHFTQDLWAGANEAPIFDLTIAVIGFISYQLHRWGHRTSARILLLVFINLCLMVFACLVPQEVGVYLFFFPLISISQGLFDNSEKWMRLFFVLLSAGLMVSLFATDFDLIGPYSIDAPNVKMFFMINLISSGFMLIMSITFILRVNTESEKRLQMLAQEIRIKNKNLEKTNAELDRFLYSTSHDLRSPLLSIKGLVNIAQNEATDPLIQQYLGMMTERADKLDYFIREVIDYAKNKRTEVTNEKTDLDKLIVEVYENFTFLDGASHIQFKKDVTIAEVTTDRNRLIVILNNLISNAIKYHKATADDRWIKVSVGKANHQLNLIVADNGPGISDEQQTKIFEMFYRGTERSKGSGLGLYIVKETIDKMGGTIRVESTLGASTSFFVMLPLSVTDTV